MFWKWLSSFQEHLLTTPEGMCEACEIDLVAGQTTKQTKLYLRVIYLTKGLANLVESFQFLLHKLCGEVAGLQGD